MDEKKEFVINILTNNALNEIKLPDALQVLTAKVRQDITTQVEGTNETELNSLYDSLQKALKEKKEKEEEKEGGV
jgi:ribosomal silencing factor RsfS